jgi:hypothetical protein
MKSVALRHLRIAGLVLLCAAPAALPAWDYAGHRIVNQLALASLTAADPAHADFPKFVFEPAAAERIAFLSGEPDRWRDVPDLPLVQYNALDHYIDLEELEDAGLDIATISPLRYVFAIQFATGRAAHSGRFAPIDPATNADHTKEWCGFLPWAIREHYAKLKSCFGYLKTFENYGGTPEEIENARANAIDLMGIMGHYVGDGAQPLHATVHNNGWVGPNPEGYTTSKGTHMWIDGGFAKAAGITEASVLPKVGPAQPIPTAARADGRDPVFAYIMEYLSDQQKKVVLLYELQKAGKFEAGKGRPPSPVGVAFIESQLAKGGETLAGFWLAAWREAVPDNFLRSQLALRGAAKPATAP